jgi:hypothetical protein
MVSDLSNLKGSTFARTDPIGFHFSPGSAGRRREAAVRLGGKRRWKVGECRQHPSQHTAFSARLFLSRVCGPDLHTPVDSPHARGRLVQSPSRGLIPHVDSQSQRYSLRPETLPKPFRQGSAVTQRVLVRPSSN